VVQTLLRFRLASTRFSNDSLPRICSWTMALGRRPRLVVHEDLIGELRAV
jgi:hypothetical protein